MVKGYFTFTYNIAKRCVDILQSMGLCISYKTICVALKEYAKEGELKIQDMIWQNEFFISFDNINFYKHTQDWRLHNKKYQLNYIAGYICLMDTGVDRKGFDGDTKNEAISSNLKLCYLDFNQVDLFALLRLKQEDFQLNNVEFRHYIDSSKYILSLIFAQYFAKKLKAQKFWRNSKP